jgi:hypothetical protein
MHQRNVLPQCGVEHELARLDHNLAFDLVLEAERYTLGRL